MAPIILNDNDVLLGRDKECFNHVGNKSFRVYVAENVNRYLGTSTRSDKSLVVSSLLQGIKDKGGRFLKRSRETREWIPADNRLVRDKCSHAIRDAANHVVKRRELLFSKARSTPETQSLVVAHNNLRHRQQQLTGMNFPEMKYSVPVVAMAAPTRPGAYNTFGPPRLYYPSPMTNMLRQQQAYLLNQQQFEQQNKFSPRYEVTDNEELFSVALDIPGIDASNLMINVQKEASVLTLSGVREIQQEKGRRSKYFHQSFSMDPTVDTDKFTARLQNGVLTMSAPKNVRPIEEATKKIPIIVVDDDQIEVESLAKRSQRR